MRETYTRDFTVDVILRGNLVDDKIRVGCLGVGSHGDRLFSRSDFEVGYFKHDPYSLVARQWFIDHPVPAKVWKVGDVVPKHTAIGKAWTAAPIRTREEAERQCASGADYGVTPMNVGADKMCREDRVILWIEP